MLFNIVLPRMRRAYSTSARFYNAGLDYTVYTVMHSLLTTFRSTHERHSILSNSSTYCFPSFFFSVGSFVYLQFPRVAISYTSNKYVINSLYELVLQCTGCWLVYFSFTVYLTKLSVVQARQHRVAGWLVNVNSEIMYNPGNSLQWLWKTTKKPEPG
jgi:hypothetical protein